MKLTAKQKTALENLNWELLPLGDGGAWIWLKADDDGNRIAKEGDNIWKRDARRVGVKL